MVVQSIVIYYGSQHLHYDLKQPNVWKEMIQHKTTHLSGNAFHNNSGHRRDSAPLWVIERTLWMIQAGQGSDLFLGQSLLIGRLKEGYRKAKDQKREIFNVF